MPSPVRPVRSASDSCRRISARASTAGPVGSTWKRTESSVPTGRKKLERRNAPLTLTLTEVRVALNRFPSPSPIHNPKGTISLARGKARCSGPSSWVSSSMRVPTRSARWRAVLNPSRAAGPEGMDVVRVRDAFCFAMVWFRPLPVRRVRPERNIPRKQVPGRVFHITMPVRDTQSEES